MFEFYYQSFSNPFFPWIFIILYFVPFFIAFLRNHQSKYGILILNLFLGWTFIFWVISLAWALSKKD